MRNRIRYASPFGFFMGWLVQISNLNQPLLFIINGNSLTPYQKSIFFEIVEIFPVKEFGQGYSRALAKTLYGNHL